MKTIVFLILTLTILPKIVAQDTLVHLGYNKTILFLSQDSSFEYYKSQCLGGYIYGKGFCTTISDTLYFNFDTCDYLQTNCQCKNKRKSNFIEVQLLDIIDSSTIDFYRVSLNEFDTNILAKKTSKFAKNIDSIKFKFRNPNKDFFIYPRSSHCTNYQIWLSELMECSSLNQLVLIKSEDAFFIKSETRNGVYIAYKRTIKWVNTKEYRRKVLDE